MAREYARIVTSIWRNAEFRALAAAEQRLYLLLVTQPDISAAGVLAFRPRRWAEMAVDSGVDGVRASLAKLERGRFVVVDEAAEEVLVRSFIRWDGGFNNPKRRPVIIRAGEEVHSPTVRRALVREFERCNLPSLAVDGLPDSLSSSPTPARDETGHGPSYLQQDGLSRSPSDVLSPSEGVVVTEASRYQPTTHNPQPLPPPADGAKTNELVAAWIDACVSPPPKRVVGHMARQIKELLDEGIPASAVWGGIEEWMTTRSAPSALPSVVNTVMNRRPNRIHSNGYHSQTDANIAAFLRPNQGLVALPGGAS